MRRLLIAPSSRSEEWAAHLRTALPFHAILTAVPDDPHPIAYAAVGRPEPGLIRRLPGLELVLSLNAGIEHLLAGGEVPKGVPIVRMVDHGLTEGMSEWVLAQVLAWHRNLFAYRRAQMEGRWAPQVEVLARERVIVVLGAGALGLPVARALAMVGFQVRTWSRSRRPEGPFDVFVGSEALGPALRGADVLVNLLPLTPETTGLLNGSLLDRLSPGAFLVNPGRGGHLVDADVLAALGDGRLSGAALDVFHKEPLEPDHPFWTHPRIVLSPHVAAVTHPATATQSLAETVRRFERGEGLGPVVDLDRGY
jgi:glyoxylate/hydroxypyruvate reductase A